MPCSDGGGPASRDERLVQHEGEYKYETVVLQAKLDKLTDLLCQAGRARHNKTEIPRAVLDWWYKHCRRDAARGEFW